METNLNVRYHNGLPEVDFSEFLKSKDSYGIEISRILNGAKGSDFRDCGQSMCYDYLWRLAIGFVSPILKHYNGWTQAWYVEEFLRRCGFTYQAIRGQRKVCYNGQPL